MEFYHHFAAAERLYGAVLSPVCGQYGLTHMELTVLLYLANHPGADTAGALVRFRHLTKSHVSVSVRTLQQKGYLIGETDAEDRRAVHLQVTEAAQPAVRAGQAAQRAFGELLADGFSPREREQLLSMLQRIGENTNRALERMRRK